MLLHGLFMDTGGINHLNILTSESYILIYILYIYIYIYIYMLILVPNQQITREKMLKKNKKKNIYNEML